MMNIGFVAAQYNGKAACLVSAFPSLDNISNPAIIAFENCNTSSVFLRPPDSRKKLMISFTVPIVLRTSGTIDKPFMTRFSLIWFQFDMDTKI